MTRRPDRIVFPRELIGRGRIRAAVLLVAVALLAGCTSGRASGPTPGGGGDASRPASAVDANNHHPFVMPSLPPTAAHNVTLVVEAPAVKTLDIAYEIGSSDDHDVHKVSVPWKLEAQAPAFTSLIDLAVTSDQHVGVSCAISVDGKVVVQKAGFGAVVCHYVF